MSEEAPKERTIPGPLIVLPVLVFAAAVVSILGYWLFSKAHSAPGPPPSIAVLPFVSKDVQFLGDGIAEQVIEELSPIPDFVTIARTSVLAMRGSTDVKQIGAKLNVRTVMFGTVERAGGKVQVSARLLSAGDGSQIWAKSWDREAPESFAIEDEIARAVVDALGLRLAVPLEHAAVTTVEAYDSYLKGRDWRLQGDERAHATALYRQAVNLDLRYAPAYARLAEESRVLAYLPESWQAGTADARSEAMRAAQLDPQLAFPHVVLGELNAGDWNWRGARGELERALALNSADPEAMTALAMWYLAPMGSVKDAIGEMNHVVDLDPLNPDARTDLGLLLYLDKQNDAAVAQLKGVDSAEAKFLLSLMNSVSGEASENPFRKACALARRGELNGAMDALDQAVAQHDPYLAYLKTWPAFDTLRSGPRFQALLKKLNLA
jgi:TolB-like protein